MSNSIDSPYTFTTQQLQKWIDERREWNNPYWNKSEESRKGYEMALTHLEHHIKHPIKEII